MGLDGVHVRIQAYTNPQIPEGVTYLFSSEHPSWLIDEHGNRTSILDEPQTKRVEDIVIGSTPQAYIWAHQSWHTRCLILGMVKRGDLSPAALDMDVEDVLYQHSEVNASPDDAPHPMVALPPTSRCFHCGHLLTEEN